jgi:hypothetical protein
MFLQEKRDTLREILRFPNIVMYVRFIGDVLLHSLPSLSVLFADTTDTSLPPLDARHLLNKSFAARAGIPCFWRAVLQFTL